MPNLISQSPDIGQNSNGCISDFQVSSQFLINEISLNSRTSNDIDMKLGPVNKLEKRNLWTSKNFDDDVMSVHCDVIVTFPIYVQFEAEQFGSWIPERMVFKTYILINSNLLSYKSWKQNKKISNGALILLLWVKVLFFPKNDDFLEKNADISKTEGLFTQGGICSETAYVCVLTYQI